MAEHLEGTRRQSEIPHVATSLGRGAVIVDAGCRHRAHGLSPDWYERLEGGALLERVHRLPEAVVRDGEQAPVLGCPDAGVGDEVVALLEVVEDPLPEDEEPPVDAHGQVGRGLEARDAVVLVGDDDVEGARRADGQQGPDRVRRRQGRDHLVHRGVGEHVAVVGEEHLVLAEVLAYSTQPLADLRAQPGVDEGDAPLADVAAEELHLAAAVGQDEVVGGGLLVVEEVVLDHLGAVAQAQHELGVTEVGVVAHDVPEDRTVADGHHRLGARVVADPHPEPESTAEEDDLHGSTSRVGRGKTSRAPQSRVWASCLVISSRRFHGRTTM